MNVARVRLQVADPQQMRLQIYADLCPWGYQDLHQIRNCIFAMCERTHILILEAQLGQRDCPPQQVHLWLCFVPLPLHEMYD